MKRRVAIIGLLLALATFVGVPYLLPVYEGGTPPATFANAERGQFINVDGLNIYVETWGEPDDPAVLFIHGLFGSTFTWRYNAPVLAEAGYYAIAFDRPGAGLSDKPFDWDYGQSHQAEVAAAILDELGVDSVTLVGHSAGAIVQGHLALRDPQRVDAQVVIAGTLGMSGPPGFASALLSFPPIARWATFGIQLIFTEDSIREAIKAFQEDPSFLTEVDFVGYERAVKTPGWAAALVASSRDATEQLTRVQLRSLNAPTLLIWGGADEVTPPSIGDDLENLLPQARLIVYPDVGHQPMEENAEPFNEDLLVFLDDTIRGSN